VGFVGVFDAPESEATRALLAKEGVAVLDPVASVGPEVEALRAERVDLVVLLAHAPDVKVRTLVTKVPGIEIALAAHPEVPGDANDAFEGTTVIMRTIRGGGGPLSVHVKLTPGGQGVVEGPSAGRARRWVGQIEEQIARQTQERAAATDAAVQANLDVQLAHAKKELEEARKLVPPSGHHEVDTRIVLLEAKLWRKNWDPRVVAATERFKADLETIGLDPKTLAELEAPGETPTGVAVAYRGAADCAQCHAKQTAVWKAHPHARAWDNLASAGNDKDPNCVRCHSIGFRQPGGFAEVKRAVRDVNGVTRDFRAVQCEPCHGPRLEHPQKPGVGFPMPTIDRCRSCHDHEHDPTFDELRFKQALVDEKKKVCVRN
jgi:hypothetical protein